ncbi:extracellular solute-binding protein [Modestobacter altitudinis]|uniref:extracellular solute-binding protein n=1 Tax=Modestobacter altitudinis TaxID=2213158 RepID=UPI001FE77F00|nr:extracellular solute-binding protein [Modestobacter altitudinis]
MRRLAAALMVLLLAGCGADDGADEEVTGTVTVLADTSLTDVFTGLGQQLEADHPGLDVQFDFGASADLAERLTDGAPADVFAAAGTDPMDVVTNNGIVSRAPTLFATDQQAGDLVGYPICTLTDAPDPDGALAFVELVVSDAGQQALTAAGFSIP